MVGTRARDIQARDFILYFRVKTQSKRAMRAHFLVGCLLLALRRGPSGVATFKGLYKVVLEFYLMCL